MEKTIKILVWGTGWACKQFISYFPKEWEIAGFVDSDKEKQGKAWGDTNILISAPSDIEGFQYDYIVVMTSFFYREILAQIMKMGISPLKVIHGTKKFFSTDAAMQTTYLRDSVLRQEKQKASGYVFENRQKGYNKLFYVLAGYKETLWDDVFVRMERFIPEGIDVCVLSSGLYSQRLSDIANRNGWSYLSTNVNDVAIIQNIAISLFPKAELIYKMDEDVYITKGCCQKMEQIWKECTVNGEYNIGLIGPMIPLHTNGHLFLERFSLKDKYREITGKTFVLGGQWSEPQYLTNPDIPKFLWGQGNIDELNERVEHDKEKYIITPVKYAICFILFSRSLYEEMGGFEVHPETLSAGTIGDEGQILNFCMQNCRLNIVAVNTLCGHFSYPRQHEEMLKFREGNYHFFELRENSD